GLSERELGSESTPGPFAARSSRAQKSDRKVRIFCSGSSLVRDLVRTRQHYRFLANSRFPSGISGANTATSGPLPRQNCGRMEGRTARENSARTAHRRNGASGRNTSYALLRHRRRHALVLDSALSLRLLDWRSE